MRTLSRNRTGTVAVGWSTRPAGSTVYVDSQRHMRIPGDRAFDRTALCGARIPAKAISRSRNMFASIIAMNDRELDQAHPCEPCERKAWLMAQATH